MPKGVEHDRAGQNVLCPHVVRTAVMPKGVEHMRNGSLYPLLTSGENRCDAERR